MIEGLLPFLINWDEFKEHLIRKSVGSTNSYVRWRDLAEFQFFLPNRDEQLRIKETFSSIQNCIDNLESCIDKTRDYFESSREHLLTKGISHNKYQTITWLFNRKIEIPTEWQVLLLKQLSKNGIQNGIFKTRSEFGSGTKLVNVEDLYSDFGINFETLERVKITKKEFESYKVKKGDILFDRSSLVFDGIGQSNIALETHESSVFECHVMRLSPNKKIIPGFLFLFTRSNLFREYIFSIAKLTTMTTITQPDLGNAPIFVPSIPEQKEIVSILSKINETSLLQKTHLDNLYKLRRSVIYHKLRKEEKNDTN